MQNLPALRCGVFFWRVWKKDDDVTASICACPETTGPCWFEVPAASLRLHPACLSGRCCFGRAEKGEIYTGEESVHMQKRPQTFRPSDPPRPIPFFFPPNLRYYIKCTRWRSFWWFSSSNSGADSSQPALPSSFACWVSVKCRTNFKQTFQSDLARTNEATLSKQR